MITVKLEGLYLDRVGHTVGIVKDRGAREQWRYLTSGGYYVLIDGRAALRGESRLDLIVDVTPQQKHLDGADSMFGCMP